MCQIYKFPTPEERKKLLSKLKGFVCASCKTTDLSKLKDGKLCFGKKQFLFFGKSVCHINDTAHFHAQCSACGNSWEHH